MKSPLHVLIIFGSEKDTRLLVEQFQQTDYEISFQRIDSLPAMEQTLNEGRWDIILSEYNLPGFTAFQALELLNERNLDLPFIIVSEALGEEAAVEAVKAGAHDYIMKNNLTRLVPSVSRELQEAKLRQKRRQDEESLREREERFREISASAQDAIIMMDYEGNISYFNKAAEKIFGYTAAEAIGKPLHHLLVPSEFHESFNKGYPRFAQTGQGEIVGKSVEMSALRKGGQEFPIGLSVSSVKIKGKWNAVGILRDITDRKSLEKQLRHSQKMEAVGRLAGGIAHDFNNLLTAITGYAELISMNLDPRDPLGRSVEEIKKAGEKASSLTSQLLAFSSNQALQPEIININDSVDNTYKMLQRLIGEDIDLITNLQPNLWRIKSEPGQIEQVIMNLAINARDAMPLGGKLTIATANVHIDDDFTGRPVDVKTGPYIMLTMSDTGQGMDEKTKNLIFEPFFTTKDRDKGSGLGLATVYGIIRKHGGYINVYSELERGSTFNIYLPRIIEDNQTEKPSVSPTEKFRGSETILLVEDDEAVRTVVREILQKTGYNVLETSSAGEALLVSEQHTGLIHLMVSDVVMPRMSGPDLAERLESWHPEMKVLYMSGYAGNAIVNNGMSLGGKAFIKKPFTTTALLNKVREVLDIYKQSKS